MIKYPATLYQHGGNTTMLSNVERRANRVEQHDAVEHSEIEYDDGEVVLIALCEKVDEEFEDFVDEIGLDIRSGPKYVGVGLEVMLA